MADKKYKIFVPKLYGSKNQPPLTGSVNGKNFALPRGQESEVPAEVFEVVSRSLASEDAADTYYANLNRELLKQSKKEAETNQ